MLNIPVQFCITRPLIGHVWERWVYFWLGCNWFEAVRCWLSTAIAVVKQDCRQLRYVPQVRSSWTLAVRLQWALVWSLSLRLVGHFWYSLSVVMDVNWGTVRSDEWHLKWLLMSLQVLSRLFLVRRLGYIDSCFCIAEFEQISWAVAMCSERM